MNYRNIFTYKLPIENLYHEDTNLKLLLSISYKKIIPRKKNIRKINT